MHGSCLSLSILLLLASSDMLNAFLSPSSRAFGKVRSASDGRLHWFTVSGISSAFWNAVFCSFVSLVQPTTTSTAVFSSTARIEKKTTTEDIVKEAPAKPTYLVSQTVRGKDACARSGLAKLGITKPTAIFRNLSYQEIFEHEKIKKEGNFVNTGTYDCRAITSFTITPMHIHPLSVSVRNIFRLWWDFCCQYWQVHGSLSERQVFCL